MRKLNLFVGAIILLIAGSCNQNEIQEPEIDNFVAESFSNLDLEILGGLETPYKSAFSSSSSGARTKGGFADIAAIATKLAEIFPNAHVLEIESHIERGLEAWEIKLVMSGGGILKIQFVKELGEIVKMRGRTGPYDYQIKPGGSFISISAAKQVALDAVGGEVAKWTLELEEENHWEYEFHIVTDTQRFEVEIDAFTGNLISIKEKHEGDDADNDGEEEGDNEGNDEEENILAPDHVANYALELFQGAIKHSERVDEGDLTVWRLYVVNEARAAIKIIIKVDQDQSQLIRIRLS